MEIKYSYQKWFQKVMSMFVDIFYVCATLVTLYAFTVPFSGILKYVIYIAGVLFYYFMIRLCKDRLYEYIRKLIKYLKRLDKKTMLVLMIASAIILKMACSLFFSFDSTVDGDIQIYNDIANQIIETGNIHSSAISHLFGVALHLTLIKLLKLPLDIGLFIAIMIGILFNFCSFSDIIGKEKSLIITMAYILMPSTSILTFCPTHEIFVFMYVSMFLFFYNKLICTENKIGVALWAFLSIFSCTLTCFVNPGGYILYIIIVLTILLSNVKSTKKAILGICLIACILLSNLISSYLNVNEYKTSLNTYTILIHGTNPESLGEQIDGYPKDKMREYIFANTLDFSHEGFLDAARHVLINQILYLLKNPVVFIHLIVHKFYILWSGVHYPIELAYHYEAMSTIVYFVLLVFNTLIYLMMLSIGLFYNKKRSDEIKISNYKLELLGVIALTLVCIVLNKYAVYVTMFIYLIAFYRAGFENEK